MLAKSLLILFSCAIVSVKGEEPESAIVTNTECGERLPIDYAQISFTTDVPAATLNAVNSECYKCAESLLSPEDDQGCSIAWTPFMWQLTVNDPATGDVLDDLDYTFGEHGVYLVSYNAGRLSVKEVRAPINSLQPLWIFTAILVFVVACSFGIPVLLEDLAKAHPSIRSITEIILPPQSTEDKKQYNGLSATAPLLEKIEEEEELRSSMGSHHSAHSNRSSNSKSHISIIEQVMETQKQGGKASFSASSVDGKKSFSSSTSQSSKDRHSFSRGSHTEDCDDNTLKSPFAVPAYSNTSVASRSSPVTTVPVVVAPAVKTKPGRVSSLDTFRGISLGVMMFVNYGGGGYWFFDHSAWNGLTFADVLFPWFMWMMGVSMALSYASMQHHGVSVQELWRKAIKRTVMLFAIGLWLDNGHDYNSWRIPGVLQYFAFSYFITSCTVLSMWQTTQERISCIVEGEKHANERSSNWTIHPEDRPWFTRCFSGLPTSGVLVAYCYEWIPQVLLVILYLAITYGGKAEGCPQGYVGPGGLAEDGQYPGCTGGIHRTIDLLLFGKHHMYLEPTCTHLYGCVGYDPEGCVGSLTACTLTYLGLMSGRVIIHFNSHKERLTLWAIGAAVLLFLAGCLCGFSQDDGAVPVNKNLWSTSFGLVTAGSGLVGLGVTYVLVDVKKWWSGAPFRYVGMNSIFFYCAHELFEEYFPFSYSTDSTSHAKQLQMNVIGVSFWFLMAYYFYRIKFFVKV